MKANIDTVLVGSRVVLVPYRPEHVPKYHEWMLDEELRTLTASEPLTLEEEYEMQAKWQMDEDKLTFIILARQPINGTLEVPAELLLTDEFLASLPMVGDVNIFLHGQIPSPEETSQTHTAGSDDEDEFHAEVEIMIAEPSYRRKGLALEALQLMLGYATGQPQVFSVGALPQEDIFQTFERMKSSPLSIPPASLITRISDTNLPSISLFEKLGFQVTKRVEVFHEIEMKFIKSSS